MAINLREARSLIRKAKRRVPEGEAISHLNITPMMDMMTILLVFMIKSLASAASPLSLPVSLPPSSTQIGQPEEAVTVTIAKSAILVEGEPVVAVKNGDVDASEKTQGTFSIEIGKLRDVLSKHHNRLYIMRTPGGPEPDHELTLVADKDTPYRLLYAVLYTAGQARATTSGADNSPGFTKYRLIVLKATE